MKCMTPGCLSCHTLVRFAPAGRIRSFLLMAHSLRSRGRGYRHMLPYALCPPRVREVAVVSPHATECLSCQDNDITNFNVYLVRVSTNVALRGCLQSCRPTAHVLPCTISLTGLSTTVLPATFLHVSQYTCFVCCAKISYCQGERVTLRGIFFASGIADASQSVHFSQRTYSMKQATVCCWWK